MEFCIFPGCMHTILTNVIRLSWFIPCVLFLPLIIHEVAHNQQFLNCKIVGILLQCIRSIKILFESLHVSLEYSLGSPVITFHRITTCLILLGSLHKFFEGFNDIVSGFLLSHISLIFDQLVVPKNLLVVSGNIIAHSQLDRYIQLISWVPLVEDSGVWFAFISPFSDAVFFYLLHFVIDALWLSQFILLGFPIFHVLG